MRPPSADASLNATIMIVDDDPVYRSLMRPALEEAGYSVIEAVDGDDALRRCADVAPALVVVDAVMPNIDGFELCRQLRARAATQYLPILMATGLDDPTALTQAYEAGATDFVTKPIDGPILVRRVRYMLRGAQRLETLLLDVQQLRAIPGPTRDLSEQRS